MSRDGEMSPWVEQHPLAGGPSATAQDALGPLRGAGLALLTSFRRNGQGVSTPVSIAVANGKVYFTTWSTTAKVKRLGHTPRVTLAPCTHGRRVVGPTMAGTARRLEGAEAERVRTMLGGRVQRWLWELIYQLVYHAEAVLYEVSPLTEGPAAR